MSFPAITVISTFTFTLIRCVSSVWEPALVRSASKPNSWLWHNTVASIFHALFIGIAASVSVLTEYETTFSPYSDAGVPNALMASASRSTFIILATSTGYFVYDLIDMLRSGMHKTAPHLIFHHVALLVPFMIALFLDRFIPYLVVTLVCEVNSVFLHGRKLLSMAGALQTASPFIVRLMYWQSWGFLVLTMILNRLGVHAVVLVQTIDDFIMGRFPETWLGILAISGMFAFNALNVQLVFSTVRALSNDLKRARGEKKCHDD